MFQQIKRPERRVFGKDITNIPLANQFKGEKCITEKHNSLNLKYIPNIKPIETIKKPQVHHTDAINQYKKEILEHMLRLQKKFRHETNENVSKNMREILIDWMIDVHMSFELKQQTLHLALSYLNEFESKAIFSKEEYQLVGITCLWIASKYEEIYPPRMANYVDVTANTYTAGQMKRMQERIMEKLSFNLNHITMLSLLEASIFNQKSDQDLLQIEKKSISYAKYILETIVLEGNYLQRYNPSKIVSTVLLVCNSVFKTKFDNKKLKEMKKYSKQEIFECYKEIVELLRSGKSYASGAIKRKYQAEKYYKVGKLKIQLKNDQKPVSC